MVIQKIDFTGFASHISTMTKALGMGFGIAGIEMPTTFASSVKSANGPKCRLALAPRGF